MFRFELDYYGVKISKTITSMDQLLGLALEVGPFFKVCVRDLRPGAPIPTAVGIWHIDEGSATPHFNIHVDGGDGRLVLIPLTSYATSWRFVSLPSTNTTAATGTTSTSHAATQPAAGANLTVVQPCPPGTASTSHIERPHDASTVVAYEARRNIFVGSREGSYTGIDNRNTLNLNKVQYPNFDTAPPNSPASMSTTSSVSHDTSEERDYSPELNDESFEPVIVQRATSGNMRQMAFRGRRRGPCTLPDPEITAKRSKF